VQTDHDYPCGTAKRRGEAPHSNGDDLASYRRLAAWEDPFGLATTSPLSKAVTEY
jgi:hypothetical protein